LKKGLSVSARYEDGWHVHTITPTKAEPKGAVVYLHGGGWINEAASAHWTLVQKIASEACVRVVVPAYPLVHTGGPAETVAPTVAKLCARIDGPIVLMGDSAAGNITVAAGLLLARR